MSTQLKTAYAQGVSAAMQKFAAKVSDIPGLTDAQRKIELGVEATEDAQAAEVKRALEKVKQAPKPGTPAFDAEAKRLATGKNTSSALKRLAPKLLRRGR